MAKSKESLSKILKDILGSNNVYNSPPARMKYPCILYKRDDIYTRNADNIKYTKYTQYSITYIRAKNNETVVNDILDLPMCSFDREYTSDNLKHTVFTIYW